MDVAVDAAADVVVLNAGLWAWGYAPGDADDMLGVIRALRAALPAVRVVWKTTTPYNRRVRGDVVDEWEPALRQERVGLVDRLVREGGVEVFPAYHLTAALGRGGAGALLVEPYWDALHFNLWVYDAMNLALVRQLCV